jgi:antitoxin (DNA-binding transcriptional repressor) of toxin-antitoxin stability system
MRSVNIAELKNRLSTYVAFARGGEEIIIRNRNLPVAKPIPFSSGGASEEELLLVAAGKMRLPELLSTSTSFGKSRLGASVGAMRLRLSFKTGMKDREKGGCDCFATVWTLEPL